MIPAWTLVWLSPLVGWLLGWLLAGDDPYLGGVAQVALFVAGLAFAVGVTIGRLLL